MKKRNEIVRTNATHAQSQQKGLYNKCWGYSYKSSRQHFLLQ